MVPQDARDGHHLAPKGQHDEMAASAQANKVNHDWMRDPLPLFITPFQRLVRDIDWGQTAIGPMADWTRELKQMVRLTMAETSPCILYWGETYTILYNEAYLPLVGDKHPEMLAMDAPEVFPDFWDKFDKIISEQRRTGLTATGEASMLLMNRHGYLEETYFDWKLIPIIGDDGEMKGSYGVSSELTKEVIGLRRTRCTHELAKQVAKASTIPELWEEILRGLQTDAEDIPFALLYSVEEQTSITKSPSESNWTCHLEGCIGVEVGHLIAREYMDIRHDINGFAPTMLRALMNEDVLTLEATDPSLHKLLRGIGWKGHGLASSQFAIVPLKGEDEVAGFLVVGLNPYRRQNSQYTEFLEMLADVIGPRIFKIRLSEEAYRREEMAKKAALDFQKSEMKFTKFAKRSIVGLAVADTNKNITFANDAWFKFSGLEPCSRSNLSWISSVHPDDVSLAEEWWDRVLMQKKGGQFQFRSKQPFRQGHMSSDYRTAICACYPDLNETDEVESMMSLIVDISELKWIEEQLRQRSKELEESERNFRNYAEHCPLGIMRTDGEGYVKYGNDAWLSFYGFKSDEAIPDPQPWLPYLHEDDVQPCKNFFTSLQQGPGPTAIELRLKDGIYTIQEGDELMVNARWTLATGFSEFKADGTVDYIDFWVTEISSQKMATKILTEKMEEAIRLKTHQERFIDMISHEIRNPLSAVLHCGEEVVEAMKECCNEIQACSGALQSRNDSYDTIRRQIDSALDSANTIMYCVQHQKKIVDDVLTMSKLDAELLVVSPVPIQPVSLVRKSLKIFEHELKMTEISLLIVENKSLVDLGVEWILLDPNRFLQIVINLVTNAIKFTQTSPERKITVSVAAMINRPSGDQLGVEFVPHRYPAVQPSSPAGEVYETLENIYLCFDVRDTGKGLTPGEMALLFNRFTQASPKTHIEYGGSGLGLFISRQICEMLGGRIGMASRGSGCTFAFFVQAPKTFPTRRASLKMEPIFRLGGSSTIHLPSKGGPPVTALNGLPETATNIPPALPEHEKVKRAVLVVEDNLVNQKVLCKLLRNRGFVVKAANHGREALDALESSDPPNLLPTGYRFNVILCDIEMPVMNGIEFAQEVRSMEKAGGLPGHIPIIGVTANVRGQHVNAAIVSGMDGVTTKPYRIDELIAHIDWVCLAKETGHQKGTVVDEEMAQ